MKQYATVDEFIHAIDSIQKEQVQLLRTIVTTANPELMEHIKWNSPSYTLNGDDRITFNVRPNHPVAIILHMGTARPENKNRSPVLADPLGLIEWKSDIRGIIPFTDLDDIRAKEPQLVAVISQWLKISS